MSNTELIGCVQHDCAKCKAVQDEVYLRNGDVLRLMKERDSLAHHLNRQKQWKDAMRDKMRALEVQLATERRHNERATNHLQDQRDALQAQLAAAQVQIPRDDISLALLERLSKTLTRLGYATPEGGMEHFNAVLPHQLYNLCWGIDGVLDKIAAPIPQQVAEPSVPEGWKQAVALAYGHLWHVNNEPMAPTPLRSSETAAYEARKQLRDLLTHEERGLAINQVQTILAAAPQPKEPK